MEKFNGIISDTYIGIDRASAGSGFSIFIEVYCEEGNDGAGKHVFLDYRLDKSDIDEDGDLVFEGLDWGIDFIKSILIILEMNNWENLRGISVLVEVDDTNVIQIGNPGTDLWFNLKEAFEELGS